MKAVEWKAFNFTSILLLVFTIISQSHPLSFPDASSIEEPESGLPGVNFLDIQTTPSIVTPGGTFRIIGIIVNNTPYSITYHGLCESPISASLDRNVVIERTPACMGFSTVELKSGEKSMVTGPTSGITYRASSAGITTAVVTFTYEIKNETSTVSKPFAFFIQESSDFAVGKLGYPLKLHIGQNMMIEPMDIAINFVNVVQDSRCPSDVTCVWQGDVTVLVNIMSGKKMTGNFNLTSRAGQDDLAVKTFDGYRIKLLQVEPYPTSAKKIELADYTATLIVSASETDKVSKHVYVKAATESDRLIVSWNVREQKGVAVYTTQGTTTILRFIPTVVSCLHQDSSACMEATVNYSSTQNFSVGNKIHLEIDEKTNVSFLVKATEELFFKMYKMKSMVTLGEGSRESNFLVKKVYPDHIDGLNFIEYPLARTEGLPLTLHLGESASNGCTVKLTLLEIHDKEATFLKTLDLNRPCPICLSGDTFIDTPNGPVNIKKLKDGMSVWTLDNLGHKRPAIILKTGKTLVPSMHTMIHIILNDGRELLASARHPTADGRLFGDLTKGDILDNSHVKSIERVPYNETYTYDILPSGSTGFYWANGILVGSTLKN